MKLLGFLLLAATTLTALASSKSEHQTYLEGRIDEASIACQKYLLTAAKDPDSIKLDEKYSYSFGKVLTKNWIYIYLGGWGKNSYGAVLRHNFTCEASCKRDQPCSVLELKE
jgi:hypothetical protein